MRLHPNPAACSRFTSSTTRNTGTTHGSPYCCDRQVPILLFGKHVKKGELRTLLAADIVTTFAALCGIAVPAADGRVLTEVIR